MKNLYPFILIFAVSCKNQSFSSNAHNPPPTGADQATSGSTAGSGPTSGIPTAGSTGNAISTKPPTGTTTTAGGGSPTAGGGSPTGGATVGTPTVGGPTAGTPGTVPPSSPTSLTITFRFAGGNAAYNDCIYVRVNGQPPIKVGCNITMPNQTIQIPVISRPAVNQIGVDFSYQNTCCSSRPNYNGPEIMNISTSNPSTIFSDPNKSMVKVLGLNIYKKAALVYGTVNDDGDKNPDDMTFEIQGLEQIAYQFENLPQLNGQ